MTLRLKAPEPAPEPLESASQSPDEEVASRKRRTGGPGARHVLIGVIVITVLFDLAMLLFRVPLLQPGLEVNARGSFDPFAANALAADTARVDDELRLAKGFLLQDRNEFLALMSRLEAAANEHGWTLNSVIRPAFPAPNTTAEHQRLPVEITLVDRVGATAAGSAGNRLESWLRHVDFVHRRVDVNRLAMRGGPNGLTEVGVELHFWIVHSNEASATE